VNARTGNELLRLLLWRFTHRKAEMTDKRCFLQWFVLLLSYGTAAFFAAYYGLLQSIWRTDVTYMTSVIGAIFAAAALYIGFASWRFDSKGTIAYPHNETRPNRQATAIADSGLGRTASYVITLVGLLGTVIGLTLQMRSMATIDVGNINSLVAAFKLISTSLGSAFYATGCGIIGSIGIIVMVANLDYFLDRDEVTQ
jgi:drug/metabolite transporter (DMT)-like permease